MKQTWFILAILWLFCLRGTGGQTGEGLVFQTVKGEKTTPLRPISGKPVVLIFIATDCPVANGYIPEINRIYEKYSDHDVRFTMVHPDASTSDESARDHAEEYSLQPPVVVDRKHQLVKAAHVTTTPEVAVFDGNQKLVYRGRIDDRYSDYGDRKPAATVHNLRDTLDAVISGKPVSVAGTPALGCLIEPLTSL